MKLYLLYKKDDVIGIFDDKEYVENFCKENNEKFLQNVREKVETEHKELLEDIEQWYWIDHEDYEYEIIMTEKMQLIFKGIVDLKEFKENLLSDKWFTSRLGGYIIGQRQFKFLEFELNKMKEI